MRSSYWSATHRLRRKSSGAITSPIHKFKGENGTTSAVDLAAEHERIEREFWLKGSTWEPPSISPLPQLYQPTAEAFKILAAEGGGAMKTLAKDFRQYETSRKSGRSIGGATRSSMRLWSYPLMSLLPLACWSAIHPRIHRPGIRSARRLE